jgi:hypothetical protein
MASRAAENQREGEVVATRTVEFNLLQSSLADDQANRAWCQTVASEPFARPGRAWGSGKGKVRFSEFCIPALRLLQPEEPAAPIGVKG